MDPALGGKLQKEALILNLGVVTQSNNLKSLDKCLKEAK